MFKSVRKLNRFGLTAGMALWVVIAALAAAPAAHAQAPADAKKFKREIRIMENMFNHVVVDSRNVLVQSHDPVNGVYLPGYGAVFTVEAQLLLRDRNIWRWINWKDDDKRSWRRDWDDDDDDDDDDADYDHWKERSRKNEERLYTDAKAELSEALLDYGDSMSQLAGTDWVAICMCLEESAHIGERRISKVTIRAKVQDLRDYASKKLSESAALAKLEVEEY